MGLKVEKPETYDGARHHDVDTWLFQVEEHMSLTRIPVDSQVAYVALLLRRNAAIWWGEICESENRLDAWEAFKTSMHGQFCMDNLTKRETDDLYALQQKENKLVSDFLHKFQQM